MSVEKVCLSKIDAVLDWNYQIGNEFSAMATVGIVPDEVQKGLKTLAKEREIPMEHLTSEHDIFQQATSQPRTLHVYFGKKNMLQNFPRNSWWVKTEEVWCAKGGQGEFKYEVDFSEECNNVISTAMMNGEDHAALPNAGGDIDRFYHGEPKDYEFRFQQNVCTVKLGDDEPDGKYYLKSVPVKERVILIHFRTQFIWYVWRKALLCENKPNNKRVRVK